MMTKKSLHTEGWRKYLSRDSLSLINGVAMGCVAVGVGMHMQMREVLKINCLFSHKPVAFGAPRGTSRTAQDFDREEKLLVQAIFALLKRK